MAKRKTREEHIAELAAHGRVELVGEFTGMRAKASYRCLEHGEVHEANPYNLLRGTGLRCCRSKSEKAHADAVANRGRLEYVSGYTAIKNLAFYRCRAHEEIHPLRAGHAEQGVGLICCKKARTKKLRRSVAVSQNEKARQSYDEALAAYGKAVRLAPYVNSSTPLLHRCLLHNEEHLALPVNVRKGQGLYCCGRAAARETCSRLSTQAKATYDRALSKHGRVERLGAYKDAHTPILHRCLVHNEEHLAYPNNCRKGRGLICCKLAESGADAINHALAGTYRFAAAEASSLYIYELLNHPGFLKPGIAKDCDRRADAEYGAQICSWEREHRTLVFLPEQALLKATRLMAQCPSDLAGWGGATEVRRMKADALVALAQELMDEMAACANPWDFAIARGLLTSAQEKRARVLIRAGVISEAELASMEVAA